MQAWFDEAGDKGQGGVLTVAGFVATSEEWSAFSDRWDAAIHAPPDIGAFHMKDAAKRENAFRSLTRAEGDQKVRVLADTINDSSFTLVHCSIDLRAHEEFFPKIDAGTTGSTARMLRTFSHPYFYGFLSVCSMVCFELRDRGIRERFEIIFDEKKTMVDDVLRWYPAVVAHLSAAERAIMPLLPVFRNDTEWLPLQAADLIAWPLRRHFGKTANRFAWLGEAMPATRVSKYAREYNRDFYKDLARKAAAMEGQPHEQDFLDVLNDVLGIVDD